MGSRGDIQPYVALSRALEQAGHEVTLATHPFARDLFDLRGLRHVHVLPLARNVVPFALFGDDDESISNINRLTNQALHAAHDKLLEEIAEADLVVGHMGIIGSAEADLLGKPYVAGYLESCEIPRRGASAIPRAHRLGLEFRRELGGASRPPADGHRRRYGMLISSRCLEREDPLWDPLVQITGFMFLDTPDSYAPADALARFLERHPDPVFVTFGSMTHQPAQAHAIYEKAVAAAERLAMGVVVLMQGLGTMEAPRANHVILVEDVPYGWLLERVSVIVHHFGFGTAAESARAGVPSVPLPLMADQRTRAARYEELGLASRALDWRTFTALDLAERVVSVRSDGRFRDGAREIARRIGSEGNGTKRAVEFIERISSVSCRG